MNVFAERSLLDKRLCTSDVRAHSYLDSKIRTKFLSDNTIIECTEPRKSAIESHVERA